MEAIKHKRLKLKEGDIFSIPIDQQTKGYGQIVKIPRKNVFIMIVFEGRWLIEQEIELVDLIKQSILFLGFTTDALFYHGYWKIIGNINSNLLSITMPLYKIGFPPEAKLINYKMETIRIATQEEDKLLSFQHSMSPMGYQKELQAYYNVTEWESDIKYNYKHMVNILAKLNLLPN